MNKKTILFAALVFLTFGMNAQTHNTSDEGIEVEGLIWATRNVGNSGTFVDNIEDYGNYYDFDKAQNVCPSGWRLPTWIEQRTLTRYFESTWTTVNGIYGRKFDIGNNTLFLPAAGRWRNNTLSYVDEEGYYWSSSPDGNRDAYDLFFFSGTAFSSNDFRDNEQSVRCVKDENNQLNSLENISVNAEKNVLTYYSLMGQRLKQAPESGIYIVVYDNGTSEKVVQ